MLRKLMLFLLVLISLDAAGQIRVACIGDSITEGVGSGDRERFSYPSQLQTISDGRLHVRNFGKSGHTLMNKADRPWFSKDRWQSVKEFSPEIVVIKLGTNDSKPQNSSFIADCFLEDLNALIDSSMALPSVRKVLLCTPAPCASCKR